MKLIFRIILAPFSLLYSLITSARNHLYDLRLKPSVSFDLPVICIGNLSVGGTGKTPMVEYLIALLNGDYTLATLSRGYKRSTKGFVSATPADTAKTIGDEPFQFYRKFGEKITVAVGEDRVMAIPLILQEAPETEVILLDDAFQHRKVRPSLKILLTDYNRLFSNDYVLPAGRLREPRTGAGRADVVVVTKCPENANAEVLMTLEKSIKHYVQKPIFFAKVAYGIPLPFNQTAQEITKDVILITGIANPLPFVDYVSKHYKIIDHLQFADHYRYQLKDLKEIQRMAFKERGLSVLTTEKDMVKLEGYEFQNFTAQLPLFYLPITTEFIKDGENFDEMVRDHIRTFNQKS